MPWQIKALGYGFFWDLFFSSMVIILSYEIYKTFQQPVVVEQSKTTIPPPLMELLGLGVIIALVLTGTLYALNSLKDQANLIHVLGIPLFLVLGSIIMNTHKWNLPWIKPNLTSYISKITVIFVIGIAWAIVPSWQIYNIACITMCVFGSAFLAGLLSLIKIKSYSLDRISFIFIFLTSLLIYDIYNVFILKAMAEVIDMEFFNRGVVQGVAQTSAFFQPVMPPSVLVVPTPQSILELNWIPMPFLGLADLIISGGIIMIMSRYGLKNWGFASLMIGLTITEISSIILNTTIPAMMILSPCLMAALYYGSRVKKVKLNWQ
jgi:hypothetical protein